MLRSVTRASQEENLASIHRAAAMLQDAIYNMAQTAMHDTSPHNVAWIVREHDKVNGIVRSLGRICSDHSL